MQYPFALENKTILVTGASSGIGRSIAISCAQMGASVNITARNTERLDETRSMMLNGERHKIYPADLAVDSQIEELVQKLPQLDGLVLNAGIVNTVPAKFIRRKLLDEIFNINIQAPILLVQQLLKYKKIKHGASVCFISSISSVNAIIGNSMYSATKGALNSFTRSLALELAPRNIRVNAILPGFVETSILGDNVIGEDQMNIHKNNYPLGRYGKPEDVAWLSVYLMSDVSSWMTGSLLTIDGGYSLK